MSKALWLLLLLIFLSSPKFAYAVTLEVNKHPSEISQEPFEVNVSITGPNPGKNYLRVDLFKEGTSRYFGETFNGSDWYSESEGQNYFPIEISDDGTASAVLKARLGDPGNRYEGPGDYKLKIRRYTSSTSYATKDDQEHVDVKITAVLQTPTPTPTQTSTPKPTMTSTPSPTPKKTATPSPKVTSEETDSEGENPNSEDAVLGLRGELENPVAEDNGKAEDAKFPISAIFLISGGTLAIGFSAFSFFKQKRKGYNQDKNGSDQKKHNEQDDV